MANKHFIVIFMVMSIITSCSTNLKDTFNSLELTSDKGERIYINSLNWGVTDDYQMTAISSNREKAKKRSDSSDVIKGLDPFIYTFRNDTLNIYFDREVRYRVSETFRTIVIKYVVLPTKEYKIVRRKASNGLDGFYTVPNQANENYNSDIR